MYKLKLFLHRFGIHDWSKYSSMMCGNVTEIQTLEDYQKFSYRHCHKCGKEMPHSRHYNFGVIEKNAKFFNTRPLLVK
jgi:hypothetical protein